ncbi:hypothetical protein [Luteimonas sp. MHLX1A]|nr:hypothetical protein [Luteimonas sp. MHLX1A]MCD9046820.1 hypothetical protein [Luteimonas sp. MHLX1A]
MPKPRVLAFIAFCWLLMPLMCIWLMLTHPGKCALIWKREITGTWFNRDT